MNRLIHSLVSCALEEKKSRKNQKGSWDLANVDLSNLSLFGLFVVL